MLLKHKYIYYVDDIYLVTEYEKEGLETSSLPWNIYNDPVKLAAGYIRWSDEKQNSGHSLSIQERELTIKAKTLGYQVIVLFVEAATSAFHKKANKRSKMNEMKEFILNNSNANSVIFYDESRVTRMISDFHLDFVIPVRERKPEFKLYATKVDGEWDENNPLVQMRLALAYDESLKKSYAILKYQETVIKDCDRPRTRLPYGYSRSPLKEETELFPNENAPIVQFIFFLYSFGYSERKIAKLLEESNIPSPSEYKHWNDSSVRYILNNPWYKGNLVWFSRASHSDSKKKPLEETSLFSKHHTALIGDSLWETTQFFRVSKKKDRMDSPFILRNLVECNECGETLKTKNQTSAKSKTDGSIYFCPSCKKKIHKDYLHSKVLNDFSLRWSRELKSQKNIFKRIAISWKKLSNENIQALSEHIDKLRYKQAMLKEGDDFYLEFKEAFDLQLKLKEKEKALYSNVLQRINDLLEDPMTVELIDRFSQNLQQYSNEEKRSILLLTLNKLKYAFERNHFIIDYRLSPFVDIETLMQKAEEHKSRNCC